MAMPILQVPTFPDVPFAPGVPSVLRPPGQLVVVPDPAMIFADAIGVLQSILTPVWGVFDEFGLPVALADTTLMVEYMADSRVSNYPQEQGAFGSYNKVQMPYHATVTLACGRTVADREAFLASIDAAKQSTDLYTIVSPEGTYPNANIVAYDYRRTTRNGATLVIVNLHIEEIRQTGTAQFANTQNPASADAVSQGQVQSQLPVAGDAALFGPLSGVL